MFVNMTNLRMRLSKQTKTGTGDLITDSFPCSRFLLESMMISDYSFILSISVRFTPRLFNNTFRDR